MSENGPTEQIENGTTEQIMKSEQAAVDAAAEKSKNQLKNDKKREEKMAKFLAKQDKVKEMTTAAGKVAKPKTLNVKTETFEDRTIPGEKKGTYIDISMCISYRW